MNVFTTLNRLRDKQVFTDNEMKHLLGELNKDRTDDEPLALLTVLNATNVIYAISGLRAVDGFDREKRLFAIWCARQVESWFTDDQLQATLEVAERFANEEASAEELHVAYEQSLPLIAHQARPYSHLSHAAAAANATALPLAACAAFWAAGYAATAAISHMDGYPETNPTTVGMRHAAGKVARDAQEVKFLELFCNGPDILQPEVPAEAWRCASMHDPSGRRGIWFAVYNDNLVVRGGREGDDAWAIIPRSSLPEREFKELRDALSYGAWQQEDYGPNTQLKPFATRRDLPIKQAGVIGP